jgi:hypothetical protein
MRIGAGRRASCTARAEDFVFTAFRDWWQHRERGLFWNRVDFGALFGHDALAIVIRTDKSLPADASLFADTRADGVRVLAGGVAALAQTEYLVFTAWWQHLERSWFDFGALFGQNAASIAVVGADVSFLAGAARDTDTRADGVGVFAGAIAALALTEFFVITAHLWWQWHGFGSWNAAGFRRHAHAVFVFQVAGFAEATDDALQSADGAGVRVGAGRGAGGTAWQENFVFFALSEFRRVGEEHGGFRRFALLARHAKAARVSQMSLFAEASDDAVLGADWARVGIGASRGASGAAWIEFFIIGTLWNDECLGEFLGSGLAFVRAHAFALGVLQESLLTETADDALEGTHFGRFRIGTIRYTGGSTGLENGIGTAFFFRKSRGGDSERKGANAEQQRESKARVHR